MLKTACLASQLPTNTFMPLCGQEQTVLHADHTNTDFILI